MYVTLDSHHKMAYIGLREHEEGIVADSLPLDGFATETGIEALHHLILDFDTQGRLIGIEV